MVHAFALDARGRHNEAIEVLQSILRRDPAYRPAKANLIPILLRERRFDEARVVAENDSIVQTLIDGAADRRNQRAALNALGNPAMREHLTPIGIAYAYIHVGRPDLALERFERAVDARATQVSFIFTDPDTEPVRTDPRFIRMKQRVGL
jgi:tetratricopeptide (TPR) repeat protein